MRGEFERAEQSAKAASRTLSPPVKAPKAGITRRVASAAKQRRLTARPRCATRATGCRWPAISPLGAGRQVAKGQRADRQRRLERAADVVGRFGIVIAGDPDPVAAALQRAQMCRGRRRDSRAGPPPSWKLSPSAIDAARRVTRDQAREPRQRRRGVVRRQQLRRARQSSSLFPDADRRRRAGLARANRARRRDRRSGRCRHIRCHFRSRASARGRGIQVLDSGFAAARRPGMTKCVTASPPSPVRPPLRPAAHRPPRHRPSRGRSPASPEPPAARHGRALYGRFGP